MYICCYIRDEPHTSMYYMGSHMSIIVGEWYIYETCIIYDIDCMKNISGEAKPHTYIYYIYMWEHPYNIVALIKKLIPPI